MFGAGHQGWGPQPLCVCLLRVKTAVARKEESVSSLRKQYQVSEGAAGPSPPAPSGGSAPGRSELSLSCALSQAAVQRADCLEALLEQQRKQLLATK